MSFLLYVIVGTQETKPEQETRAGTPPATPGSRPAYPGLGGGGPASSNCPGPAVGTPGTEDPPRPQVGNGKNHKSRVSSDFQSSRARDPNYFFMQITYKNDPTDGRGGLCIK